MPRRSRDNQNEILHAITNVEVDLGALLRIQLDRDHMRIFPAGDERKLVRLGNAIVKVEKSISLPTA